MPPTAGTCWLPDGYQYESWRFIGTSIGVEPFSQRMPTEPAMSWVSSAAPSPPSSSGSRSSTPTGIAHTPWVQVRPGPHAPSTHGGALRMSTQTAWSPVQLSARTSIGTAQAATSSGVVPSGTNA